MSDTPAQMYEIGHFHCEADRRLKAGNVLYIVCEVAKDIHYVLHLDSKCGRHRGVWRCAQITYPQYGNAEIIGGGRLAVSDTDKPNTYKLSLTGHSEDYGEESSAIRAAFTPMVAAKLQEIGIHMESNC